jgi:peptidoglycan hydrolase-like protein with peptidoglycan-binding domain
MKAYLGRAALALAALVVLSAQAPPRVDPAYEAARAAYERLDEAARKAIQDALVWTGDHNGVVSGVFGRRTYEAMVAVQKRARAPADGILDDRARAALIAAGAREKQAAGFETVLDERSGVRIGVPTRMLRDVGAVPGAVPGTRWQSADQAITLDTRSYRPDEQQLPELYERIVGSTVRRRKITYKILRPDFFVVQGETATGKFFIRSDAGPGGVRGFSVGYDKGIAPRFDRAVIAIANSFEPFPSASRPAPSSPALAPQAGIVTRPAAAGTVLVLAPGRGVTSAAALAACVGATAGGRPVTLLRGDGATGLALVEIGPDAGRPARVFSSPAGAEGAVVLARAGGENGLLVTPGERIGDSRIAAALQPGSGGAVVVDRTGALVGLVTDVTLAPRLVAGIAPPATYPLAAAASIAALVPEAFAAKAEDGATKSEAKSAGEIAASLAPSLLALRCR